jgi:hypothetical protein
MDGRETYLKTSEYKDKEKLLVLDGQQRLQAFYIALKGTYNDRELYFNILSGDTVFWELQDELKYNFEYLTPAEAGSKRSPDSYWVLLKDIVMSDEPFTETKWKILGDMQKAGFEMTRDIEMKVDTNGNKIVTLFALQELIYYYTIDGTVGKPILYDEILEIFIRANSGGTVLSKSDLMFSLIKLSWDSAEDEFEQLLGEMNKQNAFNFDKDFILKTSLVLIGKRARFAVEKFKGKTGEANLATIHQNWHKIIESFHWLSDFLAYARITSDQILPSYNALIPLIYYAFRNDNKLFSPKVKNNMQTWLYGALLNGNFSGQSDGIIDTCTDVIKMHSTADYFPFEHLDSELRRKYNRIVGINPNIIDGNAQLVLNLIYLYNKHVVNFQPRLLGNSPEKDHIFPKSKMSKLYPGNLVNDIGNYMLLEKSLNIIKTNELPKKFFEDARAEQPDFFQRNLIPNDPQLHQPENFPAFVSARRKLICDTLKEVLVYVGENGEIIRPGSVVIEDETEEESAIEHQVWDFDSFFEALEKNDPNSVKTARKLLEWGERTHDRIWWSSGKRWGTFSPVFDASIGGTSNWYILVHVRTNGYIQIRFAVLRRRPPFDNEAIRREFLQRLNEAVNINLPAEAIDTLPSIRMYELRNEETLQKFLDVLEWALRTVKAASRS